MTDCEAMEIEAKAIMCLRQGQTDPVCAQTARVFARLAIKRLLDSGRYAEAKIILDNDCE